MENTTISELIDMIADCNIKTVTYDAEHDEWIITYRNGLHPDKVSTELLIDHIQNA
ncbi:MAG TPA: hypothetical protein VL443_24125 [Cyclobacteriaceae bacterium]|jgi:hypothetical protein|nr:hypothetical protein [Cyclobacteriaceae bacterium]